RPAASSFAGPVERPAAARTAAVDERAPAAGVPALAADIGAALGHPLAAVRRTVGRPLPAGQPAPGRTRPVGLPPDFDSCDPKPRPPWRPPRYRRRPLARVDGDAGSFPVLPIFLVEHEAKGKHDFRRRGNQPWSPYLRRDRPHRSQRLFGRDAWGDRIAYLLRVGRRRSVDGNQCCNLDQREAPVIDLGDVLEPLTHPQHGLDLLVL